LPTNSLSYGKGYINVRKGGGHSGLFRGVHVDGGELEGREGGPTYDLSASQLYLLENVERGQESSHKTKKGSDKKREGVGEIEKDSLQRGRKSVFNDLKEKSNRVPKNGCKIRTKDLLA